jgi:hypothetical protein
MTDEQFEWISKRAYAIWEAAGRPWGCNQHHWEQATKEREIMERTRASADGEEVLIKLRQKLAMDRPENDEREPDRDGHSGGRRAG